MTRIPRHDVVAAPSGVVHLVSQLHLALADQPRTRCGTFIECYEGNWRFDLDGDADQCTCRRCREAVGLN